MLIDFVHLQNFRKLKNCRIDFSEKQTVFVGANNSGKTTAMDALITFLKPSSKFNTRDFTLSNWRNLNAIGADWLAEADPVKIDIKIQKWEQSLPMLDIWLKVEKDELQYIHQLIPTLDWSGGLLGLRLRYEPRNIQELYNEFSNSCNNSKAIHAAGDGETFSLWPRHMWDFLEKKLEKHFEVKTYLLDPAHVASPQTLTDLDIPFEGDALNGLIKIDIINAQRGFSDANTDSSDNATHTKTLSSQLRSYYDRHLDPSINPTTDDIIALKAIHDAKEKFDSNLQRSFGNPLKELEDLNYPGFGNPKIKLSSKVNTVEGLNHDSSVQYALDDGLNGGGIALSLPEKYNGLGYQNLVSIVFKLMRFRDEWMQVGKAENASAQKKEFEPLHLVLIEEPEAHLHAQVQQVFIREAYNVLRKHPNLGANKKFSTQLVISTHSNHVAHEVAFSALRYFKRELNATDISTSKVINLSETFGNTDDTTKFAIRYLKTTHCDLFFADAVIMVEGPAERMLLPYFIKHRGEQSKLQSCYISLLEIGGSHAHRLKPLIENLGIITLVITDIDAINPKASNAKVRPETKKGYESGNDTLKSWLPKEKGLDNLSAFAEANKIDANHPVRVAYQMPITINDGKNDITVNPYTFEDALVMENRAIFKALQNGTGLLKKMIDASKIEDIDQSAQGMYDAITASGAKKAEFALDLFFFEEPKKLTTPQYIQEGLDWLEAKLIIQKTGLVTPNNN